MLGEIFGKFPNFPFWHFHKLLLKQKFEEYFAIKITEISDLANSLSITGLNIIITKLL